MRNLYLKDLETIIFNSIQSKLTTIVYVNFNKPILWFDMIKRFLAQQFHIIKTAIKKTPLTRLNFLLLTS